jgi:alpha-glucosidase
VSLQECDPKSTLTYARDLLAARKQSAALRLGDISVFEAAQPILAFARVSESERVICIFNMSKDRAQFRHEDLLASQSLGIDCGAVEMDGVQLSLGPFAAHLARF